ncbi:MAG: PilC/PilY family type IV pilus protein [Rhodanobacter sp.]
MFSYPHVSSRAGYATLAALLAFACGASAPLPLQASPYAAAFAARPSPAAASTAPVPASPSSAALAGEVEISPTPPNQTQSVPPNIVMTFDDSGSMNWTRMSDKPPYTTDKTGTQIADLPDWSDGPWRCANVIDPDHTSATDASTRALAMNGVYYNPNITYTPPYYAGGTAFSNADSTLAAVWVDGMAVNRPLGAATADTTAAYNNNPDLDYPGAGSVTNVMGTGSHRWKCGKGGSNQGSEDGWNDVSPMDNAAHTLSDKTVVTYPDGGPYYYRLKTGVTVAMDNKYGKPTTAGLAALYTASNWEAVPVPSTQYQNFANWYAYYRTRNQMARTAISRVFGSGSLANKTSDPGMADDGNFGSTIRIAWQNLNKTYLLPSTAIISSLIDTSACTTAESAKASPSTIQQSGATQTPPSCYRSAFFNWIFQIPASGGTPTRSAVARAGKFFQRGSGNTGASGTLEDPYWQPPASGTGNGNELACRQNYHMLVTDGLWNGDSDGPSSSSPPATLPDGTKIPDTSAAGVTSIYNPVHDAGDAGYASLSDIAFYYWATDLRTDLYKKPTSSDIVSPYLPDQHTNIFSLSTLSGSTIPATNINQEIYFNPNNDPATWPHMSEYLVGLGVSGQLNISTDTGCSSGANSDTSDACLLRQGLTNSSGAVGWPAPDGSGSGIAANIDDTWHAALAGRGQFFSAGNPQNLVDQLTKVLSNIIARNVPAAINALNTSVLVPGALAFTTGYSSADWSGTLDAVQANTDGTVGTTDLWPKKEAGAQLADRPLTGSNMRQILTSAKNADGTFSGIPFESDSAFDTAAKVALMLPAPTDTTNDTLANRVKYLRGDPAEETSGVMRKRNSLLGAIINSQAVYVAYPASGYLNTWPAGSPEALATASDTATCGTTTPTTCHTYESFVKDHLTRTPVVYVGANDGMLHAFDASETQDTSTPPKTVPTAGGGQELWAYVPRAIYSGLGNLTSSSFAFAPTVDATPVTRDVYFDAATTTPAITDPGWHTILVGGLRGGGRGVYALDITDPSQVTEANAGKKVLWEFNSDTPAPASGCFASYGSCNPADLGYTFGQPNIGRLNNGTWVVIVPGGYFPDCSKAPYTAANCPTPTGAPTTGTPAVAFSSLFVLDAQTGAMLAELKTTSGISSYGLSSPVLGDYNNDQVEDVAFAGDLAGNLWRYDLTGATPSSWTVGLSYKGMADKNGNQGLQPITSMPRLFPDPATNRFIVVFGTGKYLGTSDNTSTSAKTQSIYGIRDLVGANNVPITVTDRTNLQVQNLAEVAVTNNGITNIARGLSNNPVSSTKNGWYIDLDLTDAPGERDVVTPGALFDTNRVVITTLIPGTSDPCNATIGGALMVMDAATGGSGSGLSGPGGTGWTGTSKYRVVGGRVDNPPTGGTVPVATVIGGGQLLVPGLGLSGGGNLGIDDAIWRRRSWQELSNGQ